MTFYNVISFGVGTRYFPYFVFGYMLLVLNSGLIFYFRKEQLLLYLTIIPYDARVHFLFKYVVNLKFHIKYSLNIFQMLRD